MSAISLPFFNVADADISKLNDYLSNSSTAFGASTSAHVTQRSFSDDEVFDICESILDSVRSFDSSRIFQLKKTPAIERSFAADSRESTQEKLNTVSNIYREYRVVVGLNSDFTGGETIVHFGVNSSFTSTSPVLVFRKDLYLESSFVKKGVKKTFSFDVLVSENIEDNAVVVSFGSSEVSNIFGGKSILLSSAPVYVLGFNDLKRYSPNPILNFINFESLNKKSSVEEECGLYHYNVQNATFDEFRAVYRSFIGAHIDDISFNTFELLNEYSVPLGFSLTHAIFTHELFDADNDETTHVDDEKKMKERLTAIDQDRANKKEEFFRTLANPEAEQEDNESEDYESDYDSDEQGSDDGYHIEGNEDDVPTASLKKLFFDPTQNQSIEGAYFGCPLNSRFSSLNVDSTFVASPEARAEVKVQIDAEKAALKKTLAEGESSSKFDRYLKVKSAMLYRRKLTERFLTASLSATQSTACNNTRCTGCNITLESFNTNFFGTRSVHLMNKDIAIEENDSCKKVMVSNSADNSTSIPVVNVDLSCEKRTGDLVSQPLHRFPIQFESYNFCNILCFLKKELNDNLKKLEELQTNDDIYPFYVMDRKPPTRSSYNLGIDVVQHFVVPRALAFSKKRVFFDYSFNSEPTLPSHLNCLLDANASDVIFAPSYHHWNFATSLSAALDLGYVPFMVSFIEGVTSFRAKHYKASNVVGISSLGHNNALYNVTRLPFLINDRLLSDDGLYTAENPFSVFKNAISTTHEYSISENGSDGFDYTGVGEKLNLKVNDVRKSDLDKKVELIDETYKEFAFGERKYVKELSKNIASVATIFDETNASYEKSEQIDGLYKNTVTNEYKVVGFAPNVDKALQSLAKDVREHINKLSYSVYGNFGFFSENKLFVEGANLCVFGLVSVDKLQEYQKSYEADLDTYTLLDVSNNE